MCSGKLKPMYFGQEIPKLPEYMVWVCNPVLDPWHFTWVFKNHGTKFRPENKNRTSNPGHQTKTGHRIPAIRPKPDIKSRPSDQQSFPPRTLDAELRAHSKASEPGWDWQKLSFVLELKSAVQDEELSKAQSKINSALQSSLQAGFSLFETNLQNDQLQHRRYLLTSSGDEAKARAAVVASLEALTTPKSVNPNLSFRLNVWIGSSSYTIWLLILLFINPCPENACCSMEVGERCDHWDLPYLVQWIAKQEIVDCRSQCQELVNIFFGLQLTE